MKLNLLNTCAFLALLMIFSCSPVPGVHKACYELESKFYTFRDISLDTILVNGKSVEVKFSDSSTLYCPHYDRELLFNGLKDALGCFRDYEMVILNRSYSKLDKPNHVVKMPFQALEYSIDLRYDSNNYVFQNIVAEILNKPTGKNPIDLFVSQYLGEIRYGDSEQMYVEDIYDFMFKYSYYCQSNTQKPYLDTLSLLKDKVLSNDLNSDVESTVIKFIDFCIGQCPS